MNLTEHTYEPAVSFPIDSPFIPIDLDLLSNRKRKAAQCIMVIDDDQSILDLISDCFEGHGIPIQAFTNPLDATEWFEMNCDHVGLVLLDMKNPHMDGESCFALLRRIQSGVRVGLMSGNVEQKVVEGLLGAGATHFFPKPFEPQDVVDWALDSGLGVSE